MGLSDIGGLQVLFSLILNETRPQEFDDTVGKIFQSKKGFEQLTSSSAIPFVCAGVVHEQEYVRIFTVTQLTHWTKTQYGIDFLLSGPLYPVLLSCVSDPCVEVSEEAGRILLQITKSGGGLEKIFNKESQYIIWNKKMESSDSMNDLRALSFYVNISLISNKGFEIFQKTIGVAKIISMLEKNSSDILMQMNFLELLKKVSEVPDGLGISALININAISSLLKCIKGSFAGFLSSGLLDFIEHITKNIKGDNLEKIVTSDLLEFLHDQFLDDDAMTKAKTMATIGSISVSLKGLLLLTSREQGQEDEKSESSGLLWKVSSFVSSNELLLVCAAIKTITNALSIVHSEDQSGTTTTSTTSTTSTVSEIQEEIFDAIGDDSVSSSNISSMEILTRTLARPVEEARYTVFSLLLVLTKHSWGLTKMIMEGGFFEWLLDRKTESTKMGSEFKFKILQEITKNPKFKDSISREVKSNILQYIQQGTFYGTKLRTRDDIPQVEEPLTKI